SYPLSCVKVGQRPPVSRVEPARIGRGRMVRQIITNAVRGPVRRCSNAANRTLTAAITSHANHSNPMNAGALLPDVICSGGGLTVNTVAKIPAMQVPTLNMRGHLLWR